MRQKIFSLSKKVVLILLGIVFIGTVCLFWRETSMSAVDQYKPYSFIQKTLSNGVEVILIKDDVLPSLSFDIMFKVGSKIDPENKEGLVSLLMEIMDKGTKKRSATKVAEDMEMLGTSLAYNVGRDYVSFSVETLSWLDESALEILSDIITQPLFLTKEFERAKERALGWAKRKSEHFSSYSWQIFNKYLYGSHPYGFYKNGSLSSLQKIQIEDIKDFYNRYFTPERMVLSVAGRYSENIIEKLENFFGTWKKPIKEKTKNPSISVSAVPANQERKLMVVNHPSAVQSEIRMGHISLSRSHPDYLPFRVANLILGGNFTSRLMNRIRVQRGLTYGISSYLSAKKESGSFNLGLAVRNDKVGQALLEIFGVLENFHKEGITEKELEKAKQLLKNQFISGVAVADHFAHYLLYLNSNGISYKYVEEFFDHLNVLNVDIVNKVIKKHLHPNLMKILVFTNVDQIKSQLKAFEPLTVENYKKFL